MIKNKSKNLFDDELLLFGLSSSFTKIATNSFNLTFTFTSGIRFDVIESLRLKPNTQYTFSTTVSNSNSGANVIYYNGFSNNLNLANGFRQFTFTTDANGYNDISIRNGAGSNGSVTLSQIQLELGSTATAYVPYNDIQVAVGQFEQGQGKNLFDKGVNTFEIGNIDGSGNDTPLNIRARNVGFIPVNPSTQYIFSFSSPFQSVVVFYYTSTFSFISAAIVFGGAFTTSTNASFIRMTVRSISPIDAVITTASLTIINDTAQLEQGSVSTTYEPYKYLAIHNPASNDIPIPALNNKTLNEVFVGGNLITNHDFTNGTTNWSVQSSVNTVSNNILTNTANGTTTFGRAYQATNATISIGDSVYTKVRFRVTNSLATSIQTFIRVSTIGTVLDTISQLTPNINQFYELSSVLSSTFNSTNVHYFITQNYANTTNATNAIMEVDYNYLLNLTVLGLTSLTKAQMDAYFEAWQRNNAGTLLANTFIQHDQNSVPIADLNGKTLDEVFVGGQLVNNGTFDTNLTGWTISNASWDNGRAYLQNPIGGSTFIFQNVGGNVGDTFYYNFDLEILNGTMRIDFSNLISGNSYSTSGNKSNIVISSGSNNITFIRNSSSIINQLYLDNIKVFNLTALGITATKEQLDFWYSVWQQNHKLGMRVHRASGNDIPLAVLNNQSLNQVFRDGQLLSGWYNSTNWTLESVTFTSFQNDELTLTGQTPQIEGFLYYEPDIVVTPNDKLYFLYHWNSNTIVDTDWVLFTNAGIITFGSVIPDKRHSVVLDIGNRNLIQRIRFDINNFFTTSQQTIKRPHLLNLTSLGIATLTKSQLDYLYQVWQFNQVNALVARQFIQEA